MTSIKTIRWNQIGEGMIILEPPMIQDEPIPELRAYPVLSEGVALALRQKYALSDAHTVKVLLTGTNEVARKISARLRLDQKRLTEINSFRSALLDLFGTAHDLTDVLTSGDASIVDGSSRQTSSYNSGLVMPANPALLPSFVRDLKTALGIVDMLAGPLKQSAGLPADQPACLHIVVDQSYSMTRVSDLVNATVAFFFERVSELLKHTRIQLYVFSDECRRVEFPIKRAPVQAMGTRYAAFLKTVISNRQKNVRNHVMLFSDGAPEDLDACKRYSEALRKHQMDYTQIIFGFDPTRQNLFVGNSSGEQRDGILLSGSGEGDLTPANEEQIREHLSHKFATFSEAANLLHGNQIILRSFGYMGLAAVQVYDRYQGLLTLADGVN